MCLAFFSPSFFLSFSLSPSHPFPRVVGVWPRHLPFAFFPELRERRRNARLLSLLAFLCIEKALLLLSLSPLLLLSLLLPLLVLVHDGEDDDDDVDGLFFSFKTTTTTTTTTRDPMGTRFCVCVCVLLAYSTLDSS